MSNKTQPTDELQRYKDERYDVQTGEMRETWYHLPKSALLAWSDKRVVEAQLETANDIQSKLLASPKNSWYGTLNEVVNNYQSINKSFSSSSENEVGH